MWISIYNGVCAILCGVDIGVWCVKHAHTFVRVEMWFSGSEISADTSSAGIRSLIVDCDKFRIGCLQF